MVFFVYLSIYEIGFGEELITLKTVHHCTVTYTAVQICVRNVVIAASAVFGRKL